MHYTPCVRIKWLQGYKNISDIETNTFLTSTVINVEKKYKRK